MGLEGEEAETTIEDITREVMDGSRTDVDEITKDLLNEICFDQPDREDPER